MVGAEFVTLLQSLVPEGIASEPFALYRDALLRFNRGRNLVSRAGGRALVERLILESVAAGRALCFEPGQKLLDLGSGAGIPGIPLALSHPELEWVLLERRAVACDFLRREIASLGLPKARVEEGQAREALARSPQLRGAFHWGFLRAVAAPPLALKLLRPFLGADGRAVLFLNEDYRPAAQLQASGWHWEGAAPLPLASRGPRPCLQLFRPAR
ncbi:MAG TPA: RsmG family class I SAM-dependent methyltransferase [Candidatus Krumholzibacteria bacterium]|nr:RsmG family class I SAM-dependent methyltransferase [Candidatus Krumholzibacteria bacterium]